MNANGGLRPSRRVKLVVGVAAIAIVVAWLSSQLATAHRRAVDTRVIADVLDQFCRELERLGPDSEIYRRYGQFQTLEGSGFKRPSYMWQLIKPVECRRRAVFANGTADVYIIVASNGRLGINQLTQTPSESWLREHPDTKVIQRDNEVWIESPGSVSGVGGVYYIEVWASHPEFQPD